MGGLMAMQAVGSVVSARGTLAGGDYAQQAGLIQQQAANYQADQLDANASTQVGVAQQRAGMDRYQTDQLISKGRAAIGASGVSGNSTSAVSAISQIKKRGEYEALNDLWSGNNTATGMRNQATADRYSGQAAAYSGQVQQSLSRTAALGTILGGVGSMFKTYGSFAYPNLSGRIGF